MSIDGVFFTSDAYTFASRPQAFVEAINTASKYGLKVGIILFHPFDADFQRAWGLPVNQGKFADFTANTTWIEEVYASKLMNIVSIGESLNVKWYVYDDMEFDKVSNLTNAQLFVDITYKITNGKTIMLASYSSVKDKTFLSKLSILHWDWYSAPEYVDNIEESNSKPLNCISLGQFIWLYNRPEISFEELKEAYKAIINADRIEIFALRYGDPTWSDAITNSILENRALIEKLTMLNLSIKYGERCR